MCETTSIGYYKSKGEEQWLPLLILWLFRCIILFSIYLKPDLNRLDPDRALN